MGSFSRDELHTQDHTRIYRKKEDHLVRSQTSYEIHKLNAFKKKNKSLKSSAQPTIINQ